MIQLRRKVILTVVPISVSLLKYIIENKSNYIKSLIFTRTWNVFKATLNNEYKTNNICDNNNLYI